MPFLPPPSHPYPPTVEVLRIAWIQSNNAMCHHLRATSSPCTAAESLEVSRLAAENQRAWDALQAAKASMVTP